MRVKREKETVGICTVSTTKFLASTYWYLTYWNATQTGFLDFFCWDFGPNAMQLRTTLVIPGICLMPGTLPTTGFGKARQSRFLYTPANGRNINHLCLGRKRG